MLHRHRTSLNPGIFFGQPQEYIDYAIGSNYKGVQAIPIWRLTGNEPGISLFEAAWNPISWWFQGLLRLPGASNEPSRVTDYIVSPSPRVCESIEEVMARRGLVQVVHNFDDVPNHVVEVKPTPGLTPDGYIRECHLLGQRLCLDTYHLMDRWHKHEIARRPELAERPSPLVGKNRDWRPAVITLAPDVRIIHVHPKNVDAFIADPERTRTGKMVQMCLRFGSRGELTLVAEYHPGWERVMNPAKSRATVRGMLRAMEQLTAPFA